MLRLAAVHHSDNPKDTAEVSSANYSARDYGVRAAMFVRDAKALCPQLVIFPYDFEAYEEVHDYLYELPIKTLPGIGRILEEKLKKRNILIYGQLRAIPKVSLLMNLMIKGLVHISDTKALLISQGDHLSPLQLHYSSSVCTCNTG
ncbi:DNA repair protein REV1-like isoform X2 [Rosa chinensis]|uniref:DNA repair protein REV1-like isoform X2 n=1 Tax=Rosa chinensis TaxID=74649 RepID=UPI001AD9308B|nr:DNA repair protein REV1-like isoform X2 [Rosa chinensis]